MKKYKILNGSGKKANAHSWIIDTPVEGIDIYLNTGKEIILTKKILKKMLIDLENTFPKPIDSQFKFTTLMECCGKDQADCTCWPKTKFVPDEPKKRPTTCCPEGGCGCEF